MYAPICATSRNILEAQTENRAGCLKHPRGLLELNALDFLKATVILTTMMIKRNPESLSREQTQL